MLGRIPVHAQEYQTSPEPSGKEAAGTGSLGLMFLAIEMDYLGLVGDAVPPGPVLDPPGPAGLLVSTRTAATTITRRPHHRAAADNAGDRLIGKAADLVGHGVNADGNPAPAVRGAGSERCRQASRGSRRSGDGCNQGRSQGSCPGSSGSWRRRRRCQPTVPAQPTRSGCPGFP